MKSTKPTIKDIAKLAGVSIPTVHKSIYGKPGVSEQTRARILEITHELNYSVNVAASCLKRGMWNIAIVLPLLPHNINQFFRKIWDGIDEAEKMMLDYNVTLIRMPCGHTSAEQFDIFENILQRDDIHGVITYCWDDTSLNPYFEQLKEKGIPVVTVDSDAVDSCRIGCVTACGERTGRLAAEILCKMVPPTGRILLLGGSRLMSLLRANSFGFFSYVDGNYPDLAIFEINNTGGSSSLEDVVVQELENHRDISGIYCNSASNVISMCQALKRTGRDHSVVAIGSDIFDELVPYLEDGTVAATIWQAPELQSKDAVWMLYEYLSGQAVAEEIRYVKLGIIMNNNYCDYL